MGITETGIITTNGRSNATIGVIKKVSQSGVGTFAVEFARGEPAHNVAVNKPIYAKSEQGWGIITRNGCVHTPTQSVGIITTNGYIGEEANTKLKELKSFHSMIPSQDTLGIITMKGIISTNLSIVGIITTNGIIFTNGNDANHLTEASTTKFESAAYDKNHFALH